MKNPLKPNAYDYDDAGRRNAARHCDRLREFEAALTGSTGAEAVRLACMYLHDSQSSVAAYAGLSRSRVSELKRKKAPTKADQNALIAAFMRRWII